MNPSRGLLFSLTREVGALFIFCGAKGEITPYIIRNLGEKSIWGHILEP
jgi:hypothetical protein